MLARNWKLDGGALRLLSSYLFFVFVFACIEK